ncbi:hypothetical protein CHS0354_003201 [Potamilus streckersoni]|uniref:Telomerase reverse transcriptase n=1 Tax=Potamilus streckersoni TaxID=2493646 RepID=A0AAE0SJC3_9BIVA|nr:hypothetical protein CHS0354_003201 [Potamilus streckersoni]
MSFLLENTSIFVQVVPTCFLQLTGLPVYSMRAFESNASSEVHHRKSKTFFRFMDKRKQYHSRQNKTCKSVKWQKSTHTQAEGNVKKVTLRKRKIMENAWDDNMIDFKRQKLELNQGWTNIKSMERVLVEGKNVVARGGCTSDLDIVKLKDENNMPAMDNISLRRELTGSLIGCTETSKNVVTNFTDSLNPINVNLDCHTVVFRNNLKRKFDNKLAESKTKRQTGSVDIVKFVSGTKDNSFTSKKTETTGAEHTDGMSNEGLTSITKSKRQKRRKKKKKTKMTEAEAVKIPDFKPYKFHLYLPRSSFLYYRNLRERFHTSFTLSGLNCGLEATLQMYKIIFQDTAILDDNSHVRVIVPDSLTDERNHQDSKEDKVVTSECISQMCIVHDIRDNIMDSRHGDQNCFPQSQNCCLSGIGQNQVSSHMQGCRVHHSINQASMGQEYQGTSQSTNQIPKDEKKETSCTIKSMTYHENLLSEDQPAAKGDHSSFFQSKNAMDSFLLAVNTDLPQKQQSQVEVSTVSVQNSDSSDNLTLGQHSNVSNIKSVPSAYKSDSEMGIFFSSGSSGLLIQDSTSSLNGCCLIERAQHLHDKGMKISPEVEDPHIGIFSCSESESKDTMSWISDFTENSLQKSKETANPNQSLNKTSSSSCIYYISDSLGDVSEEFDISQRKQMVSEEFHKSERVRKQSNFHHSQRVGTVSSDKMDFLKRDEYGTVHRGSDASNKEIPGNVFIPQENGAEFQRQAKLGEVLFSHVLADHMDPAPSQASPTESDHMALRSNDFTSDLVNDTNYDHTKCNVTMSGINIVEETKSFENFKEESLIGTQMFNTAGKYECLKVRTSSFMGHSSHENLAEGPDGIKNSLLDAQMDMNIPKQDVNLSSKLTTPFEGKRFEIENGCYLIAEPTGIFYTDLVPNLNSLCGQKLVEAVVTMKTTFKPEKQELNKGLPRKAKQTFNLNEEKIDNPPFKQNQDVLSTAMSYIEIPFLKELIPLLQMMITKHRKCPYRALLNYYCPVHTGRRKGCGRHHIKPKTGTLLEDFTHHRQVYLFLRSVILRVVPEELFGSSHNKNIFLKNCKRQISAGKFEKVCLGQLVQKMKTSDCKWLNALCSNFQRLHMLAKLLFWLMGILVFHTLKTFFYITESSVHRHKLFYYRQSVWHRLHTRAIADLLKTRMLKPISEETSKSLIKTCSALGVSTMRFLPKTRSLRPIVNMGSSQNYLSPKGISINKQLANLQKILSYLKEEEPNIIGAGKMGTDNIYTAWQAFADRRKQNGSGKLYFVKTDITNCYDTILEKKLFSIIREILEQADCNEYIVRRYGNVYIAGNKLRRVFNANICRMSEYKPDFIHFAREKAKKDGLHDNIFVDKVLHKHESIESLLQLLSSHLFNNIIKLGSSYFLQSNGISQGSVLSTLLCNLFYGHMERSHFTFAEDELIMRVVDDYLFVTPTEENAKCFLDKMLEGIPEYNCFTNISKVLVNFHHTHERLGTIAMIDSEDSEWFPWCGMMFSMKTLDVRGDYSRYAGVSIGDTMTFDLSNKPGKALRDKLLFSVRQKCHHIFMDISINSPENIVRNCYYLFMLSAFRFHACARQLPWKQRPKDNPHYFFGILMELASHVWVLCRHKKGIKSEFILQKSEILWLCLKAFLIKMKRHHSEYMEIIKMIKPTLSRLEKKQSIRLDLMAVTDCGMPNEFEMILN